ncbi:MAG: hypothetical protein V7459_13575 [Oceanicoccus sp.]
MKFKKVMLATAISSALVVIVGCTGDGDKSTINIDETINNESGGTGSVGIGDPSSCPAWASSRPIDSDGNDVCQVPANILENRTLTSDIVWYMEATVTVGNGNGEMSLTEGTLENGDDVTPVLLSIDAGTEIKGATGSFANMIITRGSQIQAVGTASLPIIFSSADDGYDGSGEWGGLILHGYGLHNECLTANMGAVACNVDAEGESGFAGGYSADDSSGRLEYVVVTEGGFEFSTGNEINGISFVAVGSGTEVDYIQVDSNADDGLEFYGGSVSAKHLVITGALDDSVDWDEGWQGNLQHVLVVQSADSEGNAIEADTEGTLDFLSKPTIANATFIGDGEQETLAVFKKTSGGFVHHSVFTSAASSLVTTCVDSSVAAISGTELVFTNVVADCTTSGDVNLVPAPIADVDLDANFASQAVESSSVGALDIVDINATYSESVADPAFFDASDYAGAVNPDGSDLWYQGWVIEGTL